MFLILKSISYCFCLLLLFSPDTNQAAFPIEKNPFWVFFFLNAVSVLAFSLKKICMILVIPLLVLSTPPRWALYMYVYIYSSSTRQDSPTSIRVLFLTFCASPLCSSGNDAMSKQNTTQWWEPPLVILGQMGWVHFTLPLKHGQTWLFEAPLFLFGDLTRHGWHLAVFQMSAKV